MNAPGSLRHDPHSSTSSSMPKALVIGSGMPAGTAAETLVAMGAIVTLVRCRTVPSQDCFAYPAPSVAGELKDFAPRLDGVEVVDIDRDPIVRRDGDKFKASFEDGVERTYDCVLLAPATSLRKIQSAPLQDMELFSNETELYPASRIAFLFDCAGASDPALGMCAIRAAANNVLSGGESVVCLRNTPVLHLFGETLYDEARRVGVQFVRFGDELPTIFRSERTQSTPPFHLIVEDVIGHNEFAFDCDRALMVTGPDPSSIPAWVTEIITRNDVDDRGFALSDSVHCASGRSFGNGIFIVGGATGNLDLIHTTSQAKAAAAKAYAWMKTSRTDHPVSISSDCVGCLTCYRICPHAAISIKSGMSRPSVEVWPSLCRECGICASRCPTAAITLASSTDDSVLACVNEVGQADLGRTTFVIGCRRSAGALAQSIELPHGVRFVDVPCAGRVSEHIIWYILASGARGVLLAGCHHGNCASEKGTKWADWRVRKALATGLFGKEPPRLGFVTVAANEPVRFERVLREFVDPEAPL